MLSVEGGKRTSSRTLQLLMYERLIRGQRERERNTETSLRALVLYELRNQIYRRLYLWCVCVFRGRGRERDGGVRERVRDRERVRERERARERERMRGEREIETGRVNEKKKEKK